MGYILLFILAFTMSFSVFTNGETDEMNRTVGYYSLAIGVIAAGIAGNSFANYFLHSPSQMDFQLESTNEIQTQYPITQNEETLSFYINNDGIIEEVSVPNENLVFSEKLNTTIEIYRGTVKDTAWTKAFFVNGAETDVYQYVCPASIIARKEEQ